MGVRTPLNRIYQRSGRPASRDIGSPRDRCAAQSSLSRGGRLGGDDEASGVKPCSLISRRRAYSSAGWGCVAARKAARRAADKLLAALASSSAWSW